MTRKHAFSVISTLLGIGVSLILAEAASRVLAPPWLEARMNFLNPGLSGQGFGTDRDWKTEKRDGFFFRFEPNTQFDVSHLEYRNIAHIDDRGTRRIYPGNASKRGPIVPLLGDSFVFGIGVEDGEAFPSVLARDLPNFTLVNLGVPGSALDLHLRLVRMRHDEFGKPARYVFFFFIGNDLSDILRSFEKSTPNESMLDNHDADANTPSQDWLRDVALSVNHEIVQSEILRRSYFIQWVRRFVLQVNNDRRRASGRQPDTYPLFLIMDRTDEQYYSKVRSALEKQVGALASLQKELGFLSLVIVVPDSYQLNVQDLIMRANMYGYDQNNLDVFRPNRLLEDVLRKYEVRYFDPTPCLESIPTKQNLYYKSDNHFTKFGNCSFAKCVKLEIETFLDR